MHIFFRALHDTIRLEKFLRFHLGRYFDRYIPSLKSWDTIVSFTDLEALECQWGGNVKFEILFVVKYKGHFDHEMTDRFILNLRYSKIMEKKVVLLLQDYNNCTNTHINVWHNILKYGVQFMKCVLKIYASNTSTWHCLSLVLQSKLSNQKIGPTRIFDPAKIIVVSAYLLKILNKIEAIWKPLLLPVTAHWISRPKKVWNTFHGRLTTYKIFQNTCNATKATNAIK